MRILLSILFLSSLALAIDLPQQEVLMNKSGWVYVITRDLSTLTVYSDGSWECKSSIMQYDQMTYLRMLYQNADKGNWLRKLAMLSRYWVYKPTPWEAMGITKDQYDDWLATGTLKTQAELDALKQAKADAQQQQIAAAIAEISAIQYYLSPDGIWHTTKDCIDCVKVIEVNPFDIMKIPNAKQCGKCSQQ